MLKKVLAFLGCSALAFACFGGILFYAVHKSNANDSFPSVTELHVIGDQLVVEHSVPHAEFVAVPGDGPKPGAPYESKMRHDLDGKFSNLVSYVVEFRGSPWAIRNVNGVRDVVQLDKDATKVVRSIPLPKDFPLDDYQVK